MSMDTDAVWEAYGREDPYFGVLSHSKYRAQNLDDTARAEFFRTGKDDLDAVLHRARKRLGHPADRFGHGLDFGCGVGRVLVPMAGFCERVTGADVSPAMLAEARRNCAAHGAGNDGRWVR